MPIKTCSPEETLEWGRAVGQSLKPGAILAFFGELGVGKTTLIKGVVWGATGLEPEEVTSPTFVYLNIYEKGDRAVYHFDLYRLAGEEEFLACGFLDFFSAGGICCIEWSERIPHLLPPQTQRIYLSHESELTRTIKII